MWTGNKRAKVVQRVEEVAEVLLVDVFHARDQVLHPGSEVGPWSIGSGRICGDKVLGLVADGAWALDWDVL